MDSNPKFQKVTEKGSEIAINSPCSPPIRTFWKMPEIFRHMGSSSFGHVILDSKPKAFVDLNVPSPCVCDVPLRCWSCNAVLPYNLFPSTRIAPSVSSNTVNSQSAYRHQILPSHSPNIHLPNQSEDASPLDLAVRKETVMIKQEKCDSDDEYIAIIEPVIKTEPTLSEICDTTEIDVSDNTSSSSTGALFLESDSSSASEPIDVVSRDFPGIIVSLRVCDIDVKSSRSNQEVAQEVSEFESLLLPITQMDKSCEIGKDDLYIPDTKPLSPIIPTSIDGDTPAQTSTSEETDATCIQDFTEETWLSDENDATLDVLVETVPRKESIASTSSFLGVSPSQESRKRKLPSDSYHVNNKTDHPPSKCQRTDFKSTKHINMDHPVPKTSSTLHTSQSLKNPTSQKTKEHSCKKNKKTSSVEASDGGKTVENETILKNKPFLILKRLSSKTIRFYTRRHKKNNKRRKETFQEDHAKETNPTMQSKSSTTGHNRTSTFDKDVQDTSTLNLNRIIAENIAGSLKQSKKNERKKSKITLKETMTCGPGYDSSNQKLSLSPVKSSSNNKENNNCPSSMEIMHNKEEIPELAKESEQHDSVLKSFDPKLLNSKIVIPLVRLKASQELFDYYNRNKCPTIHNTSEKTKPQAAQSRTDTSSRETKSNSSSQTGAKDSFSNYDVTPKTSLHHKNKVSGKNEGSKTKKHFKELKQKSEKCNKTSLKKLICTSSSIDKETESTSSSKTNLHNFYSQDTTVRCNSDDQNLVKKSKSSTKTKPMCFIKTAQAKTPSNTISNDNIHHSGEELFNNVSSGPEIKQKLENKFSHNHLERKESQKRSNDEITIKKKKKKKTRKDGISSDNKLIAEPSIPPNSKSTLEKTSENMPTSKSSAVMASDLKMRRVTIEETLKTDRLKKVQKELHKVVKRISSHSSIPKSMLKENQVESKCKSKLSKSKSVLLPDKKLPDTMNKEIKKLPVTISKLPVAINERNFHSSSLWNSDSTNVTQTTEACKVSSVKKSKDKCKIYPENSDQESEKTKTMKMCVIKPDSSRPETKVIVTKNNIAEVKTKKIPFQSVCVKASESESKKTSLKVFQKLPFQEHSSSCEETKSTVTPVASLLHDMVSKCADDFSSKSHNPNELNEPTDSPIINVQCQLSLDSSGNPNSKNVTEFEHTSVSSSITVSKVHKKRVSFTEKPETREFDKFDGIESDENNEVNKDVHVTHSDDNSSNTISPLDQRISILGSIITEQIHVSSEESKFIENSLIGFDENSEDSRGDRDNENVLEITKSTPEVFAPHSEKIAKHSILKMPDREQRTFQSAICFDTLDLSQRADLKTSASKEHFNKDDEPDSLSYIESILEKSFNKITSVKKLHVPPLQANESTVKEEKNSTSKKTVSTSEESLSGNEALNQNITENPDPIRVSTKSNDDLIMPHTCWKLIKIDCERVKYEDALPTRIIALLVDNRNSHDVEGSLENELAKDPRVQCYIRLFEPKKDKLKALKIDSTFSMKQCRRNSSTEDGSLISPDIATDHFSLDKNKLSASEIASSSWDLNMRKFFQDGSDSESSKALQSPLDEGVCSPMFQASNSNASPIFSVNNYAALVGNYYNSSSDTTPFEKPKVAQSAQLLTREISPVESNEIATQPSTSTGLGVQSTSNIVEYPNEKDDLEHPDWERHRSLNSEEELFSFIRKQWGSEPGLDLTQNLTVQNFRRKRLEREGTFSSSFTGKRKAEDKSFILSLLPESKRTKTISSTFMQDEELSRNDQKYKENMQMCKNNSLKELERLHSSYKESCENIKHKLTKLGRRSSCEELRAMKEALDKKLEVDVEAIFQKYKARHDQVHNSFLQERTILQNIRDEIMRYDRYCGTVNETRLNDKEHEIYVHIRDVVQSFSEIYKA